MTYIHYFPECSAFIVPPLWAPLDENFLTFQKVAADVTSALFLHPGQGDNTHQHFLSPTDHVMHPHYPCCDVLMSNKRQTDGTQWRSSVSRTAATVNFLSAQRQIAKNKQKHQPIVCDLESLFQHFNFLCRQSHLSHKKIVFIIFFFYSFLNVPGLLDLTHFEAISLIRKPFPN